ncbi:cupin [Agrobacterium cavarae]|uniref:cupin n=1 Tax=Agrobacterium cavarae TaxID=2528239 RepID=UPI000DDC71B1|nr:cupin [Agrobacterium cavarae]
MQIDHFILSPSDWVPNHPTLPVLVYSQIRADMDPSAFEDMFHDNGWTGIWRNGVFAYHHYHSGAHEVLGVGRGEAKLQIGGPDGKLLDVRQGDCLLLPAGTGHKRLESSGDFQVVGAYPPGQAADIQRDAPNEKMLALIKSLPVPETDPVLKTSGGLVELWR